MYYCELCRYKTPNRNLIEHHHIVPKEIGGSNKKFNRVWLCSNCHKNVYVKESKHGDHSIKTESSTIIKGWFSSTDGRILLVELQGIDTYIITKN